MSSIAAAVRSATMVPRPDLLFIVSTDAGGGFNLGQTWPAGVAPGSHVYSQAFYLDNTVPGGLAASNALCATTDFKE